MLRGARMFWNNRESWTKCDGLAHWRSGLCHIKWRRLCREGCCSKIAVIFCKGLSFPVATCLLYAACVVWSELFMQEPLTLFFWLPDDEKKTRLSEEQTLLVHEDYNGISNFAIQIAEQCNVRVIATYRSDGFREHCHKVGVFKCMSQDDFVNGDSTQSVDVILNTLEPEYYDNNVSSLKWGGIMISTSSCCSDTIDSAGSLPCLANKTLPNRRVIQAASLLYRSREKRELITSAVKSAVWSSLTSFAPFVHHQFQFSKVEDAHNLMEAKGCGKIILVTDAFLLAEDGRVS